MLPVKKPVHKYRTLNEIRQRKDELLDQLQEDNTKFTTLWNQVFINKEGNSKADYIGGFVSNSVVAIDTFLLIRKLIKGYGFLFGKKKIGKRKK